MQTCFQRGEIAAHRSESNFSRSLICVPRQFQRRSYASIASRISREQMVSHIHTRYEIERSKHNTRELTFDGRAVVDFESCRYGRKRTQERVTL